MNDVLATLRQQPTRKVLETESRVFNARELVKAVDYLTGFLLSLRIKQAALLADNGYSWIVADLACHAADICLLPLPQFFSDSQLLHCLNEAGTEAILTDNPESTDTRLPVDSDAWYCEQTSGISITCLRQPRRTSLPAGTAKVTFTSGTTGKPKGVCLSEQQLIDVSRALVDTTQLNAPRHLCLLPLTTLLENVTGVYAPLLAGGQVVAPNLATIGINGSSGLDMGRLLAGLEHYRPNTVILIPQLLMALTTACEMGWKPPDSLQFMAVGGAVVSPALIDKARHYGLPVYEGYGLSECASVVSLNTPRAQHRQSSGKPLSHVSLTVEDGEIIVRGNCFLGYTGDPSSWKHTAVRTGDLGHIDNDGFVHITGRRKNLLISSFGRNINPEWVEAELLSGPLLAQCVVFGDGRPHLCALLYPRAAHTSDRELQQWINTVNATLPDYARVQSWLRLHAPLTTEDNLLTDNGRPKRSAIFARHADAIDLLYTNSGLYTGDKAASC